jgi:probable F420-dependent oxidoreductase
MASNAMTAVHLPQRLDLVATLPELSGRLEAEGFKGLWIGEVNNLDAVASTALVASGTEQAAIGVLLNVFTRAPTTLAMTAATLAALAPGRMHIVLGAASPLLVERWNGIPYRRPLAQVRDCLHFIQSALKGGRVDGEYETITTNGFRLLEAPSSPPEILLAASGPGALRLAAEEADGVVLNWLAPTDLERVEHLPSDRSRVSMVFTVCPTDDRAEMDAVTRPIVADYLNVPAYAHQQRRVGRANLLGPMWHAWDRGDRSEARRLLPRSVLEELVISGSPEACRDRLNAIERETGTRAIATYVAPRGEDVLAAVLSRPR